MAPEVGDIQAVYGNAKLLGQQLQGHLTGELLQRGGEMVQNEQREEREDDKTDTKRESSSVLGLHNSGKNGNIFLIKWLYLELINVELLGRFLSREHLHRKYVLSESSLIDSSYRSSKIRCFPLI